MEEMVYLNGSLVPVSQARISPTDYGFLYGYGVFETMRAYEGHVFRLDKHLARLERSARALHINLNDVAALEKAVYETLKANQLLDARIRLTVSPGEEEPDPRATPRGKPTVFIMTIPYEPPSERIYRQGVTAIVSRVRRSAKSPSSSLKSLSGLDLVLARQEAASAGVDHAILLNDKGLVTEGSTTNVFYVKGGVLFTPAEHCGLLAGVTREVVLMELAPSLGIRVEETNVTLNHLLGAEEAFLTNSMIEIMPLTSLDGRSIGSGRPGTLTRRFMKAYRAAVQQSLRSYRGKERR